ncbi:hypothetical protein Trisim1_005178 [Trichoderma cf. simile WF8]
MLADAYTKGLRGGINWADGYKAMVKDAESQPMPEDMWGWKEGRGALYDWIPLGYLSVDKTTRSLSRTVECSANDYALSVVAAGESGPADVSKYRNRSAGWQNLWNDNVESQGFTGFLAPRLSSGEFNLTDYDPALCSRCSWDEITYEGTPWEYSFYVQHDMKSLVQFMGGARKFEERLDHIFVPNAAGKTIMNIGNEPDFATPFLYSYINRQHRSVARGRELVNNFFKGLYPITTQPVYLLQSP